MKLTGGAERNVVGVCQDFPQNCNFSNVVYLSMSNENAGNMSNFNYTAYTRTESHARTDETNAALEKMASSAILDYHDLSDGVKDYVSKIRFSALPLDETYLNGHDADTDRGNKTMCRILLLAAGISKWEYIGESALGNIAISKNQYPRGDILHSV